MVSKSNLMIMFMIGAVALLVGGSMFAYRKNEISHEKNITPDESEFEDTELKIYKTFMYVGGGLAGLALIIAAFEGYNKMQDNLRNKRIKNLTQ